VLLLGWSSGDFNLCFIRSAETKKKVRYAKHFQ